MIEPAILIVDDDATAAVLFELTVRGSGGLIVVGFGSPQKDSFPDTLALLDAFLKKDILQFAFPEIFCVPHNLGVLWVITAVGKGSSSLEGMEWLFDHPP